MSATEFEGEFCKNLMDDIAEIVDAIGRFRNASAGSNPEAAATRTIALASERMARAARSRMEAV